MAIARPIDEVAFNEWVDTRPPIIQEMCRKWRPDILYRMGENGNRVLIESWSEDGTVTVSVSGEFNAVMFDRNVFGVDPNSLVECDLPEEGEILGSVLSEQRDIEAFIDATRDDILSRKDKA